MKPPKVILFANTDWYLWNFRRSLALALRDAGHDVMLLSPPGEYGARFEGIGLRWQPLKMDRRSLNPIRELGVLWNLMRLMRRERPALVHGFTIKCAVYGSLAARIARVPAHVNAIAGMGYAFSSNDMTARLLRPAIRALLKISLSGEHARLILQNNDDVALFSRERLIDPARVRLIRGSGVNSSQFLPRRDSASDNARVLLAARLLWGKGIGEYVEAARALRLKYPQVRFLLAGTPDPGNPDAIPEKQVLEWVREGALEWLGHEENMPRLLATIDIAVLPSYYREGTPRYLIEAAICGLPIVTCDSPGCREVVTDEVNGLLVQPRDSLSLARAIGRLVESPALRNRLGQAARAKALDEFDERVVIDKTLAVYRELIG
jgi:glycosyltransferase involved in cell wall biosynthesis